MFLITMHYVMQIVSLGHNSRKMFGKMTWAKHILQLCLMQMLAVQVRVYTLYKVKDVHRNTFHLLTEQATLIVYRLFQCILASETRAQSFLNQWMLDLSATEEKKFLKMWLWETSLT